MCHVHRSNLNMCLVGFFVVDRFVVPVTQILKFLRNLYTIWWYDTATMDSFVCYTISINAEHSQITEINVKEGDDIDSIIDAIKLKESPEFDSVPASRIELFERNDSEEPLDALTPWNTNVIWGKPDTPLIVQVRPHTATSWNNNNEGKL